MTTIPATGEFLLYQTEDGRTRIECRLEGETLWLTQAQMAELFQTTAQNITLHLKAIYRDEELSPEATCKAHLQVQTEGGRTVRRTTRFYNLEAILAVGFRVRSHRGVQFRQWAGQTLQEYIRKGFALDDTRLKAADLPYKVLDEHVETVHGYASVCTMHLAKGLEFRAVVVMACDDEVIPSQARIETVTDDSDLEEVYATERQLLYVACTRARDHLLVTSGDIASEFLGDLRA
ncbi:MAG: virulence RhuM family protein [Pseudomonadales bacterium]|nr:virulence RhuM family protein [Pseudomonadales bacterium]